MLNLGLNNEKLETPEKDEAHSKVNQTLDPLVIQAFRTTSESKEEEKSSIRRNTHDINEPKKKKQGRLLNLLKATKKKTHK